MRYTGGKEGTKETKTSFPKQIAMGTYLLDAASADELLTELSTDLLDLIALSGDQLSKALGKTLRKRKNKKR